MVRRALGRSLNGRRRVDNDVLGMRIYNFVSLKLIIHPLALLRETGVFIAVLLTVQGAR
jgi:hypothetical protein